MDFRLRRYDTIRGRGRLNITFAEVNPVRGLRGKIETGRRYRTTAISRTILWVDASGASLVSNCQMVRAVLRVTTK